MQGTESGRGASEMNVIMKGRRKRICPMTVVHAFNLLADIAFSVLKTAVVVVKK